MAMSVFSVFSLLFLEATTHRKEVAVVAFTGGRRGWRLLLTGWCGRRHASPKVMREASEALKQCYASVKVASMHRVAAAVVRFLSLPSNYTHSEQTRFHAKAFIKEIYLQINVSGGYYAQGGGGGGGGGQLEEPHTECQVP